LEDIRQQIMAAIWNEYLRKCVNTPSTFSTSFCQELDDRRVELMALEVPDVDEVVVLGLRVDLYIRSLSRAGYLDD
jgi:hypothetical protein